MWENIIYYILALTSYKILKYFLKNKKMFEGLKLCIVLAKGLNHNKF